MSTARQRFLEHPKRDILEPEAAALPPGQAATPGAPWPQRVLLQHDPSHLDRLMNHLQAALDASSSP